MSMKPQPIPEIPPEMVRVVRAVFLSMPMGWRAD
jgi:hypothetical protein